MSGCFAKKMMLVNNVRCFIKKAFFSVGVLIFLYLIVWVVAYSVLMGFDYRFALEYFLLAWRGGGEIPALIQLIAILFTTVGTAIVVVMSIFRTKHR